MTLGLALLLFSSRPSGGDPGTAPGPAWAAGIAVAGCTVLRARSPLLHDGSPAPAADADRRGPTV